MTIIQNLELLNLQIGDHVELETRTFSGRFRVVAIDPTAGNLGGTNRKWDYIFENLNTGEWKKVNKSDIKQLALLDAS